MTAATDPVHDDRRRWQAVCARDPGASPPFVYAVLTTFIYCRPACPSRRPRLENVRFFATPDAAQGAGFRACKRCRPDAATPDAADLARINRASARLTDDDTPTVAAVAQELGLTPAYFQRWFLRHVGVTPLQYRKRMRAETAKADLVTTESVTDAVFAAGFHGSNRFYTDVGPELGMAPRVARAGGRGEAIAFSVGATSLGPFLVAWTTRGVCAGFFGDDASALEAELARRFPEAERTSCPPGPWAQRLLAEADAPTGFALPLDVKATAFQARVWQALRKIAPGETQSYAAVALAVGKPAATRAVAQACAANPVALSIPCHRVIRSDGALSGYRWGVDRKRTLLTHEGARFEEEIDDGDAIEGEGKPDRRGLPRRPTR